MPKSPTDIDRHVGARIRMQRKLTKMTQEKLANALGLTFQQVTKYEKGTNRIGAGRLQQIARVLGVSVDSFFNAAPALADPGENVRLTAGPDLLTTEAVKLLHAFHAIDDARVRRRVLELVRALGAAEMDDDGPALTLAQAGAE